MANLKSIFENQKKAPEIKDDIKNTNNNYIKETKSIKDRITQMMTSSQNKDDKSNQNKNDIKTKGNNMKNIINELNNNKNQNEPKIISKENENKIIEDSEIISNENPEMIIYKYPNKYNKTIVGNCKILLFIGNESNKFINLFINIYRNINYDDKFRYKIDESNLNNNTPYALYYIKARSGKKNLFIISIPKLCKSVDFIKDIMNVFNNGIIPKRLNYIFLTFEDKNQLENNEFKLFLTISNLFQKENLANKLIVLLSSGLSNLVKENNNDIIFSEHCKISFNSLFNPEYFFINNDILFNRNKDNFNEWKKLEENLKKIQDKIEKSKSAVLDKDKVSLFNLIFTKDPKNNSIIMSKLEKYNKTDKIFIINYLFNCNPDTQISKFILFLHKKIIEYKSDINIHDEKIKIAKEVNIKNTLYFLSKVRFDNLKYLICQNCELTDDSLKLFNNLFSTNLLEVNLSNNNITNISELMKFECSRITKLNLSNNKISDINCLKDNLNFKDLIILDLSFNQIQKMNKKIYQL